MGPAIGALLRAGVGYAAKKLTKKKGKAMAKDYAKKSDKMKPAKKAPGKTKADAMPAKKILSAGARKPGMSKGYKARAKLQKRLSNAKRQVAKQGHSKELSDTIGKLQDQINKSYGK